MTPDVYLQAKRIESKRDNLRRRLKTMQEELAMLDHEFTLMRDEMSKYGLLGDLES